MRVSKPNGLPKPLDSDLGDVILKKPGAMPGFFAFRILPSLAGSCQCRSRASTMPAMRVSLGRQRSSGIVISE